MATTTAPAAATSDADATAGDPFSGGGGCDSECSTPFVSAPSSPARDHYHHGACCFFSAPASPTRGGGGGGGGAGCLDFDFDFSSRFPSPSAAAMSSADELFCNGQIRPVRLAAALLQPQQPAPLQLLAADADFEDASEVHHAASDERGRIRSRSVRRKARSMSPFRSQWRRSPSPAPPTVVEPESTAEEPTGEAAVPAASRSSSSSSTTSTASSSSSSSSRGSRRWGFIKDLLNRSKSDGGKSHSRHPAGAPSPTITATTTAAPPKRSPSPSPATGRARGAATAATGRSRRRSAHERLYEARRAEAEEMRRRTYLPYRQGVLLFGCIGLGSRGYGAVHSLARGLNAAVSSRS